MGGSSDIGLCDSTVGPVDVILEASAVVNRLDKSGPAFLIPPDAFGVNLLPLKSAFILTLQMTTGGLVIMLSWRHSGGIVHALTVSSSFALYRRRHL